MGRLPGVMLFRHVERISLVLSVGLLVPRSDISAVGICHLLRVMVSLVYGKTAIFHRCEGRARGLQPFTSRCSCSLTRICCSLICTWASNLAIKTDLSRSASARIVCNSCRRARLL